MQFFSTCLRRGNYIGSDGSCPLLRQLRQYPCCFVVCWRVKDPKLQQSPPCIHSFKMPFSTCRPPDTCFDWSHPQWCPQRQNERMDAYQEESVPRSGGALIHFVFARNFQRCQIKDLNFCGVLKLKCSEISEDFFFFNTLKMWEAGRKPSLLLVIFKPKMLLSCRFLVDVQRNICSWGSCLDYYCATLLMPMMTAEWMSWSMSALEIW